MSVPKQVTEQFDLETDPRLALSASSKRVQFAADSDEYRLGSICEIRIPNGANTLLDPSGSTLSLEIAGGITGAGLSAAATLRMPWIGAHAAIDELSVRVGGNVVQLNPNYNVLFATLSALNRDVNSFAVSSVMDGGAGGGAVADNEFMGMLEGQNVSSKFTYTGTTAAAISTPFKFELPLIGLLSGASKMLPLGLLGSDVVIRIRWCPSVFDLFYSSEKSSVTSITPSNTITISKVKFNAKMVTVSDFGMQQIRKASGMSQSRPLSWSSTGWCSDFKTLPTSFLNSTTPNQNTITVGGLHPRSVNGIFCTGISAVDSSAQAKFELIYPGFRTQFRIHGGLYPPQQIENSANHVALAQLAAYQEGLPTFANLFSHDASKFDQTAAGRVRVADLEFNDEMTQRAVMGLMLGGVSGQGLDTSGGVIESMVTCQKVGATDTVTPIQLFTLLRYRQIYSISNDGEMTVAQ